MILGLILFLIICILPPSVSAAPVIHSISDNRSDYASDMVPAFEKLEVSFSISNSVATNTFFPYDDSPPPGLPPATGISADLLVSADNWQTVHTIPAFYFQDFIHQVKNNSDWIYPTDTFMWKARFAPPAPAQWQYRLRVQDASGITTSPPKTVTVVPSTNPGFIRVSDKDSRYFEYQNGTYFPGLGYNMNYNHISWNDPLLENQPMFAALEKNGIQLIRLWLSQWAIWGSTWNPWSPVALNADGLEPSLAMADPIDPNLPITQPNTDTSWKLQWPQTPGIFLGWNKDAPAIVTNGKYQISVTYAIPQSLPGPRLDPMTYPNYGLVLKLGGWLASNTTPSLYADPCTAPTATIKCQQFSSYANLSTVSSNTLQWQKLTGVIDTSSPAYINLNIRNSQNFLPNLYLVLENVSDATSSTVYISSVEVRQDLGNGQLGPNLIQKPSPSMHTYVDQKFSYNFDQVVELAQKHHVFLKPVLMEKNDWILKRIQLDGTNLQTNPDDKNFYGQWREMTKVRWLQQAWWRYVQARWGYSTAIHSWELINEGDPYNSRHWTLADEFGKYMHQFTPNHHLTTTSFWHSFPKDYVWDNTATNQAYPYLDYADVHQYTPQFADVALRIDVKNANGTVSPQQIPLSTMSQFTDTALNTYRLSMAIGAKQLYGPGKPVIRGEAGFTDTGSEPATAALDADTQGIWLHNFIWGHINPGGVTELYWYDTKHIITRTVDHRPHFKTYYDYISTIPLSNGYYQDAAAITSPSTIRAWGQKDLTNQQAHLWISHPQHTWKNVADNTAPTPLSGSVTISGFKPNTQYILEHWDTYNGTTTTEALTTLLNGDVKLIVNQLTSDYAVKIKPVSGNSSRPDFDQDRDTDYLDFNFLRKKFDTSDCATNLVDTCRIDSFDYNRLLRLMFQ